MPSSFDYRQNTEILGWRNRWMQRNGAALEEVNMLPVCDSLKNQRVHVYVVILLARLQVPCLALHLSQIQSHVVKSCLLCLIRCCCLPSSSAQEGRHA